MSEKIRYTVWVGGTEVNDNYLKSSEEAEELANKYREEGYDDVRIFEMCIDNMFHIEEICNVWYELYGEELEEGFPGFIDELKQRIS